MEKNTNLTEKEVQDFKMLFSKFCRGELNANRCGDMDCSFCPINSAYNEIFDSLCGAFDEEE